MVTHIERGGVVIRNRGKLGDGNEKVIEGKQAGVSFIHGASGNAVGKLGRAQVGACAFGAGGNEASKTGSPVAAAGAELLWSNAIRRGKGKL